ncbi:hypothetical protein TDB9533_02602 [Thalassocella blandensis]|nr:hypothetical protein TDB9533_02602 [Thalassocella blandensis]
MPKANKKQNIIVTVVAIAIVIVSSFMTYYATMVVDFSGSGDSGGYSNVTFTDATLTCERETKTTYGEKIGTLTVDNHSSRYDERQFLYKIFMEMNLRNSNNEANLFYVNCFVRSSNGKIRKYEVFEADAENPSRVDDGTNVFGMPKRN